MENVDYSKMSAEEAIEKKKELVRQSLVEKEVQLRGEGGILLTPAREEILCLPVKELLHRLNEGSLKAVETLRAFQAKALEEHKKTNCITEFVPKAEKWAIERDSTPADKRGSLHGLPVSVKENYDIEGMDTTLGLTKNLGKPLEKHAVLVSAMLDQGAVPFVKTNVPQIIYSVGCSNPIFGETKNPHDTERSPGGSSGGEAALITGGGSVIGLGTDMCGSVRIPAAFCGTYGIKPCQKRISREGTHGTFRSMIGVANASGLLGRDVDALEVGMDAIVSHTLMNKLDPTVPYIPWNREMYESNKPLKIGWFVEDQFLPVTPGIKRAIHIAKDALIKRGHQLIPFSLPDFKGFYQFAMDILLSEGGGAMLDHWKGEIIDESVRFNKTLISAPSFVKMFMEKYLQFWSPKLAKLASQDDWKSSDLWKSIQTQSIYKDELITSWTKLELDGLLGPGFPLPAPHPSQHGNLMPGSTYFAVYNYIDFPAGTLPVTIENKEDQQKLDEFPTSDYVFKCIKETTKGAEGLPLCVQIGALPWQEEKVLKIMKEIQLGLQQRK